MWQIKRPVVTQQSANKPAPTSDRRGGSNKSIRYPAIDTNKACLLTIIFVILHSSPLPFFAWRLPRWCWHHRPSIIQRPSHPHLSLLPPPPPGPLHSLIPGILLQSHPASPRRQPSSLSIPCTAMTTVETAGPPLTPLPPIWPRP